MNIESFANYEMIFFCFWKLQSWLQYVGPVDLFLICQKTNGTLIFSIKSFAQELFHELLNYLKGLTKSGNIRKSQKLVKAWPSVQSPFQK